MKLFNIHRVHSDINLNVFVNKNYYYYYYLFKTLFLLIYLLIYLLNFSLCLFLSCRVVVLYAHDFSCTLSWSKC